MKEFRCFYCFLLFDNFILCLKLFDVIYHRKLLEIHYQNHWHERNCKYLLSIYIRCTSILMKALIKMCLCSKHEMDPMIYWSRVLIRCINISIMPHIYSINSDNKCSNSVFAEFHMPSLFILLLFRSFPWSDMYILSKVDNEAKSWLNSCLSSW